MRVGEESGTLTGGEVHDAPGTSEPPGEPGAPARPDRAARRAFLLVAGGTTLAVTVLVAVLSVVRDDGHLVYTLDDAAIHLAVVKQLVHHGTWGVAAGQYESAASSIGWPLVLALFTWVVPSGASTFPLLLNTAAAVWIVWLFAGNQTFVRPSTRNWLAVAVAVVLPLTVLFLPALAMVGMEHTLHAALVLQAFVCFTRLEEGPLTLRRAGPFLVTVFLAVLARYETLFVVAGFALAFLVGASRRLGSPRTAHRWSTGGAARLAAATVVVAGIPVVAYGLVNLHMGQYFWPNSVIAKSNLVKTGFRNYLRSPYTAIERLQLDPMLLFLVIALAAYLVWAWCGGSRTSVTLAVAFVVASLLHGDFANFGGELGYERYQIYLIVAGTLVLLRVASEVVPPRWHQAGLGALLVAIVLLTTGKANLLVDVPVASSNTYRERYQMARFFERYYPGQAVATGELGYVAYIHDGPVVDFFGLGDFEVLQATRRGQLDDAFIQGVIQREHARVIGVYPLTQPFPTPPEWQIAGAWLLDEKLVTARGQLVFYAPDAASLPALERNLTEFEKTLPSNVRVLTRQQLIDAYLKNTTKH